MVCSQACAAASMAGLPAHFAQLCPSLFPASAAVLSPKQRAGVGAPGTTSAGEHSPPLAQAV